MEPLVSPAPLPQKPVDQVAETFDPERQPSPSKHPVDHTSLARVIFTERQPPFLEAVQRPECSLPVGTNKLDRSIVRALRWKISSHLDTLNPYGVVVEPGGQVGCENLGLDGDRGNQFP